MSQCFVKIEIINKCNAVNYIFSGVSGQYMDYYPRSSCLTGILPFGH